MDAEAQTDQDETRGASTRPRTLGRYRLVAELGRGSTSIVHLAVASSSGGVHKLLALKQLRPSLAADPPMVARFTSEARIGTRLDHPNVVQTLEIDDQDALPFIVMEYLDGQTLQRVAVAARLACAPLPLHMHLAVLSGAVEGLGYAHAARGYDGTPLCVVHRDVSPHNIFITSSGQAKILDFGMAQAVDAAVDAAVDGGRAAYLSPEQAAGEPVDARSDLFAIGIIMWEAVTRRRFWPEGATDFQILNRLGARELPPTRLTALAAAPADLQSMIARAISVDPAERYPSAAALQSDLQATLLRVTPPTFALRDLGQRVTRLFASDRARLQAAVDGQVDPARAATAAESRRRTTPPPEGPGRATLPFGGAPFDERPTPRTPPPPPIESNVEADSSSGPLPSYPLPPTEDATPWEPSEEKAAPSEEDAVAAEQEAEPAEADPQAQEAALEEPPALERGTRAPPQLPGAESGTRRRQGLVISAIALSVAAGLAFWVSRGHAVEPMANDPVVAPSAASLESSARSNVAEPSPPPAGPETSAPVVSAPVAPTLSSPAAVERVTAPATIERVTAPAARHPVVKAPPAFVPASPVAPTPPSPPASAVGTALPPAGVQPSRPIDNLNPYGP